MSGAVIEMRDGSTVTDQRLGYLPQTDPRNNDHRVDKATGDTASWPVDLILDQQQTAASVGYAMTHTLRAQGWTSDSIDDTFAWNLYTSAQRIDPWTGGQYPKTVSDKPGTSLLAACGALKTAGYISQYGWAFTPAQVRSGLIGGPGVLGCQWRHSMNKADDVVDVSGDKIGGHAVAIIGFDADGFTIVNSWGTSWGDRGTSTLSTSNLKKLLRGQTGRVVFPRAVKTK